MILLFSPIEKLVIICFVGGAIAIVILYVLWKTGAMFPIFKHIIAPIIVRATVSHLTGGVSGGIVAGVATTVLAGFLGEGEA